MLEIIKNISSVVLNLTLLIISIGGSIFLFLKYKEIVKIEEEIDYLEKRIDDIPQETLTMGRGRFTQSIYEKQIEKQLKPVKRQLQLQKQKRKFLLDKVPFLSLFKR